MCVCFACLLPACLPARGVQQRRRVSGPQCTHLVLLAPTPRCPLQRDTVEGLATKLLAELPGQVVEYLNEIRRMPPPAKAQAPPPPAYGVAPQQPPAVGLAPPPLPPPCCGSRAAACSLQRPAPVILPPVLKLRPA